MERFLSLVLLGMLLAQVLVLPGVLWIAGWLRWRTDYLPFGRTEHIWAGEDGAYEMTEPLMGW